MKNKELVLGLGVTGRAVAEFLLNKGYSVVGIDKNPSDNLKPLVLKGLKVFKEECPSLLDNVKTLHLSPGISSFHPLVEKAKADGIEIVSEIELALRHTQRPLLGITGTNGKTTVVLLVAHVLNTLGIPAEPLGNIGTPLIAKIDEKSVGVLELSSYQLERVYTKGLQAAVILNITPDHLDRYDNFEAYANAKFRIAEILKPQGSYIVHQEVADTFKSKVSDQVLRYSWQSPYFSDEGKRKKSHDRENLIAAFLLTKDFGISEEDFFKASLSFAKPPHRIEAVRTINDIRFWNDSKGTNVDATLKAVEAMEGSVILIAGGVDKGSPYTVWKEPFKDKVKLVISIGEAKEKIQAELGDEIPSISAMTLKEAVDRAFKEAKKGDQVLLSPGCSSFDMFRDYEDRGEQFKSLVRSLS